MATIAISLTIPMTMLADVLFKRISYPCAFYAGTVPILLAFVCVAILAHFEHWDPVLDALRCGCRLVCRRGRGGGGVR